MKLSRIFALIQRDYLLFFKAKWRLVEFFYFPITSLLIWGGFALWTGEFASEAGRLTLIINVFWSYGYILQSTINLSMSEDAWRGEGFHILITGIGKWEYLIARILFAILVSILNLILMLTVMHFLFLNISNLFFPISVLFALTALISVGLAIFIAGLIFVLGREYIWLAWSALQLFILLSSPLLPFENLPKAYFYVARTMPYGELFESVRNLVLSKPWTENANSALIIGFIYLLLGISIYRFGFDYSRKTGKLAKMLS